MASQFLQFDSLGDVVIVDGMDNLLEQDKTNVNSRAMNAENETLNLSKSSSEDALNSPLISLQQVRSESPGYEEVIIVQPAEEIVSDESVLAQNAVVGSDQILVPLSDLSSLNDQQKTGENHSSPENSGEKAKKHSKRSRKGDSLPETTRKHARKWGQKQVQVKTLEGEFSVTMWASGEFLNHSYPFS